ncbi:MAG TPA: flagellar assembly protein FliX [Acetobacteraceae bacterium]|nr:flagellar assembly protein FliX [Acetobacteraceae bacterium]
MVTVSGVQGGATGRAAPVRAHGAEGFSMPTGGADGAGESAESVAATPAALAGMLSLQELGCEPAEDRAARRRGYDLLAALSALQRGLLADGDDSGLVERLTTLASDVPESADPRLREAVAGLVLRARVELAKREG